MSINDSQSRVDVLEEALLDARNAISIVRTQIMVEINRGSVVWEGVPAALKERLGRIDAALSPYAPPAAAGEAA